MNEPRFLGVVQGAPVYEFRVRKNYVGPTVTVKARNVAEALTLVADEVEREFEFSPEDGGLEASTVNRYGRRITHFRWAPWVTPGAFRDWRAD